MSTQILDLAKLPAPDLIEELDFESLVIQLKSQLSALNEPLAAVLSLESEPLTQLLNTFAYQQLLLRSRINHVAKANLLATAQHADLEHIAARYGVQRLRDESDERLRMRTQKAYHSLNTAGTEESYTYHTLSTDPRIKDVYVASPSPCHVQLTILSNESKSGTPSSSLLNKLAVTFGLIEGDQTQVSDKLQTQKVRPIGDWVEILPAKTRSFSINAKVKLELGPGSEAVKRQVLSSLEAFLAERHGLGKAIKRSALFAVLHQAGVEEIELSSPIENINVQKDEVALCENDLSGITFEVLL
ncbi:baseplate J/gp47 family protein [Pseudoalteromonas xiamenensis]|uniref:baseplate assembly protein n=1 Tax=Pseudoalteromonas xiamenensis TaxID=882626 RepID=UPI0027E55F3E|nr:baseplate J/gp47 family protein [Pseudoalteromonas xiamenensis]WMN59268.1 baseplate J/gp47 family protein [Pseudoalteromonas xiamenensis]